MNDLESGASLGSVPLSRTFLDIFGETSCVYLNFLVAFTVCSTDIAGIVYDHVLSVLRRRRLTKYAFSDLPRLGAMLER